MRVRWFLPILVAAVCLSSSASARAQTPSPAASPAPAPAEKTEARDRFTQGLKLFEKKENAAALAEFKRAYELIPNPLVLYNIGLVYAAMERPVDAVDTLDRFLAESGKSGGKTTVEQAKRAKQVRDEQAARIAQLTVVTNKPSTIEVDGVEAGRTPMAEPLRLVSGAHLVAAVAPGYEPLRREVTLAGQVAQTVTLTLVPRESVVAHLTVTALVPGADVLVNGKLAGQTPLPASVAVSPGDATIEVRRAGYRPATHSVKLDEGASGALAVTLDEDPAAPASLKGRLKLAVSEPGAELAVDGASRALAPEGVTVVGGPHLVRIQRAGFVAFEQRIEVAAGRDTALAVTLAPTPETRARSEESARTRRLVGWSTAGAGLLLAGGSAIYAIVTRNAVSDAQAGLNGQLMKEKDPADRCYAMAADDSYKFFKCGETKASFQSDVDTAKLRRTLSFVGVGAGLAAVGVGAYLVATGVEKYPAAPTVSFWSDGQGGGLVAVGRF